MGRGGWFFPDGTPDEAAAGREQGDCHPRACLPAGIAAWSCGNMRRRRPGRRPAGSQRDGPSPAGRRRSPSASPSGCGASHGRWVGRVVDRRARLSLGAAALIEAATRQTNRRARARRLTVVPPHGRPATVRWSRPWLRWARRWSRRRAVRRATTSRRGDSLLDDGALGETQPSAMGQERRIARASARPPAAASGRKKRSGAIGARQDPLYQEHAGSRQGERPRSPRSRASRAAYPSPPRRSALTPPAVDRAGHPCAAARLARMVHEAVSATVARIPPSPRVRKLRTGVRAARGRRQQTRGEKHEKNQTSPPQRRPFPCHSREIPLSGAAATPPNPPVLPPAGDTARPASAAAARGHRPARDLLPFRPGGWYNPG